MLPGDEEGQHDQESSSTRRTSLAGQALIPALSNAASELAKERSFCNPEDTEEAAAIGRQVSAVPMHDQRARQYSTLGSEYLHTAAKAACCDAWKNCASQAFWTY